MNKQSCWFTLEPYVYISVKREGLLLYNTLNGDILEYESVPSIISLIKEMQSGDQLLVTELGEEDIRGSREIADFVADVREHFMGDLIPTSCSQKKPVQIVPRLKIKENIYSRKEESQTGVGKDIMNHLHELSLYISDTCEQTCAMCSSAYKQFLCCRKDANCENELKIEYIEKIIKATGGSRIHTIHILGGNILQYSELNQLLFLLNETEVLKSYYLHYLHLEKAGNQPILFDDRLCESNILVDFPLEEDIFADIIFQRINKSGRKTNFHFVVESEEDVSAAHDLIALHEIDDYSLHPHFKGKNMSFFEENVFVHKYNILQSKPLLEDILAKGAANRHHYGQLFVSSNGDIHTNINSRRIGNIKNGTIHEILINEFRKGESGVLYNDWFGTREGVTPCKDCHFNFLCPSLLNYERVLGKNNLCSIWPGT